MSTTVREPLLSQVESPPEAGAAMDLSHDRGFYERSPRVARRLEFLLDLVVIGLNTLATLLFFVFLLRWLGGSRLASPGRAAALLALYSAVLVLALRALHLYIRPRRTGTFSDVAIIAKGVVLTTALMLTYLYFVPSSLAPELVLCAAILNVGTLVGYRAVRMKLTERRAASGKGTQNVLIIGAGRVGQALAEHFDHHKPLGFVVKGFLDENHHQDPRLLGKLEDFGRVVRANFVDEVLITIPSERQLVRSLVAEAQEYGVTVKVIPELFDGLGLQAPIDYFGRFPAMELHHRDPITPANLRAKRLMDMAASLLGLTAVSPLMALIALLIKLDSRGPILYRSTRVGKKGRPFVCYKFRSMVANADALKNELRQRNERQGPTFKIADDPRITRFGRLLRLYSLDELPQLWNVLRGDMSLVGPRPHPIDDFQQYDLEHLVRLRVKPGITGLWQVIARRDPSFEQNMKLDVEYIENWTLSLDLKILFLTLPAVLKGNGQ